MTSAHYGPWVPVADRGERTARFRLLAGLTAIYTGSWNPLVAELRAAEADEVAAERALDLFNTLPAIPRRKILSTWGAVQWPRKHEGASR